MPGYHQMGHDSENLLLSSDLRAFSGAVLSPVNYTEAKVQCQIEKCRGMEGFQTILDPQLYYPKTERGKLRKWSYFPTDVDTADLSSDTWWSALNNRIASTCQSMQPTAVCSPAVVPNAFNDEYYSMLIRVGTNLFTRLRGTSTRTLQTAIIGLSEVATPNRSMAIASILSRTEISEIYIIFLGNTEPRRELSEPEQLKGAMKLISALETAGLRTLIGFCSSDVALWKAAGATSCAAGKFFNLRRFTPSRFEEPGQGGGQIPYWFEESLMGFIRESDLIRVQRAGLIKGEGLNNPFGKKILDLLKTSPGTPWLALSWRQFMFWFADFVGRVERGACDIDGLLAQAENNWLTLEDKTVLMEEPRNDGSWIRQWRRAMVEYQTHWSFTTVPRDYPFPNQQARPHPNPDCLFAPFTISLLQTNPLSSNI